VDGKRQSKRDEIREGAQASSAAELKCSDELLNAPVFHRDMTTAFGTTPDRAKNVIGEEPRKSNVDIKGSCSQDACFPMSLVPVRHYSLLR